MVINDDLEEDEQPRWVHVVADLRNRYLGDEHTAATAAYTDPPVSHRETLASSPFAAVETLTWAWERRLTIDEAVGLQFTYSFSTPAIFGDHAHEFAVDARDAILALHPDGYVTEQFRVEVLVATRPGQSRLARQSTSNGLGGDSPAVD